MAGSLNRDEFSTEDGSIRLLIGDCLESLRTLPDECVNCCVTSPPYWGLRDYGHDGQIGLEPTPESYVAKMVEVFREVRRVLRKDGTLWLNLGDSYAADRKGSDGAFAKQSSNRGSSENAWAGLSLKTTVANLSNSLQAVLKSSPLFIGELNARRSSAEGLCVFIYDKSSPDRVLIPFLGVKRVFVKERNNEFCEVADSFNTPVQCFVGRSLGFAAPKDTYTKSGPYHFENLAVVVAASDLNTHPAVASCVSLPVEGGKASFSIEIPGEPITKAVGDIESVRYAITINATAKGIAQVDFVNESVSLTDGLNPSAGPGGDFRVRHAGPQQVSFQSVCGCVEIALRSVRHAFAFLDGGFVPVDSLYANAIKRANALQPKQEIGIPEMVKRALMEDGWICRQTIIWHKPNPMPESVTDRCTKAHEYVFLLSKSAKYWYDAEAVSEAFADERMGNPGGGGAYTIGSGRNDRGALATGIFNADGERTTRNRRSVWTISTKPYSGAHFAVMPSDLVEPCILAGCPEGGTVLDPFAGSGTVAQVAIAHGRQTIACELNPEYGELIQNRIRDELDKTRLIEAPRKLVQRSLIGE